MEETHFSDGLAIATYIVLVFNIVSMPYHIRNIALFWEKRRSIAISFVTTCVHPLHDSAN